MSYITKYYIYFKVRSLTIFIILKLIEYTKDFWTQQNLQHLLYTNPMELKHQQKR